ncbi:hypothetical protein RJ641_006314 [Dillenia turbinata]|uniref:Uncharacterized protein n=1 Tax=Dillenia turbinata TaxID=194707 RepID=A0AAN8ZBM8_9MAGN
MSLVIDKLEVSVRPTFVVVSGFSSSGYGDLKDKKEISSVENSTDRVDSFGSGSGLTDEVTSESSSIGVQSDGEHDDDDEVQSQADNGTLGSLTSLEESLPIKRGISNHYNGKSKSFASLSSLSEEASVKDLEKTENPFNKRRRTLLASKWNWSSSPYKKSSFYSWKNQPTTSMPLLAALDEQQDQEEEEDHPHNQSEEVEEKEHDEEKQTQQALKSEKKRNFKSISCFSLSDLQSQ